MAQKKKPRSSGRESANDHVPAEGESPDALEGAGEAKSAGIAQGIAAADVATILNQRARNLARIPPSEEHGDTTQVVAFALGEEVYAVEVDYVEGINPLEELTPLPCTPDFVAGVVNLRGRTLSIIDIRHFLGLEEGISPDNGAKGAKVIAVHAAGLEVGFLVDQVYSVCTLVMDELEPSLPTTARVAAEYTRGVTPDMLVLLDVEALLRDNRMIVREEVG